MVPSFGGDWWSNLSVKIDNFDLLCEKWFVATGFLFRGGWHWSSPYNSVLGLQHSSRPYKWHSRGSWQYEPLLQMHRFVGASGM